MLCVLLWFFQGTEVKAITYSNMQIYNGENGKYEVFVIIDIWCITYHTDSLTSVMLSSQRSLKLWFLKTIVGLLVQSRASLIGCSRYQVTVPEDEHHVLLCNSDNAGEFSRVQSSAVPRWNWHSVVNGEQSMHECRPDEVGWYDIDRCTSTATDVPFFCVKPSSCMGGKLMVYPEYIPNLFFSGLYSTNFTKIHPSLFQLTFLTNRTVRTVVEIIGIRHSDYVYQHYQSINQCHTHIIACQCNYVLNVRCTSVDAKTLFLYNFVLFFFWCSYINLYCSSFDLFLVITMLPQHTEDQSSLMCWIL